MIVRKKAQVFSLILFIITIFFCLTVIVLYHTQQKNVESSLVSPRVILELEDSLEFYEIQEKEIIESSLNFALENSEFGADEFINSFRDNFLDSLESNELMKEFIFRDLTLSDVSAEDEARFQSSDFFRNILYPSEKSSFENGKLIFIRAKVGKQLNLFSTRKDKINFPVEFFFDFEKEYIINLEGGKFVIEEE